MPLHIPRNLEEGSSLLRANLQTIEVEIGDWGGRKIVYRIQGEGEDRRISFSRLAHNLVERRDGLNPEEKRTLAERLKTWDRDTNAHPINLWQKICTGVRRFIGWIFDKGFFDQTHREAALDQWAREVPQEVIVHQPPEEEAPHDGGVDEGGHGAPQEELPNEVAPPVIVHEEEARPEVNEPQGQPEAVLHPAPVEELPAPPPQAQVLPEVHPVAVEQPIPQAPIQPPQPEAPQVVVDPNVLAQANLAAAERPHPVMVQEDYVEWRDQGRFAEGNILEEQAQGLIEQVEAREGRQGLQGLWNQTVKFFSEANFVDCLRKLANAVFKDTGYVQPSFVDNLDSFRENVKTDLERGELSAQNQQIAKKMFTQSTLPFGEMMMKKLLSPLEEGRPLSLQLEENLKELKTTTEHKMGIVPNLIRKLMAKANFFVDLLRWGNLPFSVGSRSLNGQEIRILRHAVPTIEEPIGENWEVAPRSVQITPEYKAFLESCKSANEKVLYCCYLKPKQDEAPRIDALEELTDSYQDTFHFIRFPLDGELSRVEDYENHVYCQMVSDAFRTAIHNPQEEEPDFIFSPAVREKLLPYVDLILQISAKWAILLSSDREDEKRNFMMLVCVLSRMIALKELGISYYNNTCKDAIDRGAVHLFADLAFDALLTGNFETLKEKIRAATLWPAYMAKTQAVLHDRAEWIFSFCRLVEGVSEDHVQDLRRNLEGLGLQVAPLRFDAGDGREEDYLSIPEMAGFYDASALEGRAQFEVQGPLDQDLYLALLKKLQEKYKEPVSNHIFYSRGSSCVVDVDTNTITFTFDVRDDEGDCVAQIECNLNNFNLPVVEISNHRGEPCSFDFMTSFKHLEGHQLV